MPTQMATISTSDMEKIGEAAEQEYEAEFAASPALSGEAAEISGSIDDSVTDTAPTKAKRIRLSTGQRMRLVEDFRRGKLDKYYSVTIDKKRPGEFRITKRRKPLDTPEIEVTAAPDNIPVPPATTIQGEITEPTTIKPKVQPIKAEKQDKVSIEFYAMQNNINNSLSREIQAVMEKCHKIERKMKEQRAEAKAKRKTQPESEPEYEYEYSDGDEAPQPHSREQPQQSVPTNEPMQYRAFNARSRINLLRDFR